MGLLWADRPARPHRRRIDDQFTNAPHHRPRHRPRRRRLPNAAASTLPPHAAVGRLQTHQLPGPSLRRRRVTRSKSPAAAEQYAHSAASPAEAFPPTHSWRPAPGGEGALWPGPGNELTSVAMNAEPTGYRPLGQRRLGQRVAGRTTALAVSRAAPAAGAADGGVLEIHRRQPPLGPDLGRDADPLHPDLTSPLTGRCGSAPAVNELRLYPGRRGLSLDQWRLGLQPRRRHRTHEPPGLPARRRRHGDVYAATSQGLYRHSQHHERAGAWQLILKPDPNPDDSPCTRRPSSPDVVIAPGTHGTGSLAVLGWPGRIGMPWQLLCLDEGRREGLLPPGHAQGRDRAPPTSAARPSAYSATGVGCMP